MFYSDKPIESKDKDVLNRTEFSKQLAKSILSYTKVDNFTIGLCGKWGTGKTSILNMVIEEIKELSQAIPKEEKPVVVVFNPWNYSDSQQLINQFFQTIRIQLGLAENNKDLIAIGTALEKYSALMEYTTYIPKVGKFLGPLKSIIENTGKHCGEIAEKNNGVAQQKEQVIKKLKKQRQKIIVLIDDIDRLNNKQIRLIFQLVNSLAGFPNIIYVLSFDRDVVIRALESEQKCDGEEYLEKIIQVIFDIPTANVSSVNAIFMKMYADIIFDGLNPDLTFEHEYWDVVFPFCIAPFIKTMRDVKRVINTFEFKYGCIRDETNCVDLLAVTTLQVCAPEIYNWVQENATALVGSTQSVGGMTGEQQRKNQDDYLNLFETIYSKNPALMLQVVQTLFPAFSWRTNGYTSGHYNDKQLMEKQRIASRDRIKRYFALSLEDLEIPQRQLKETLYYYTDELFKDFFSELEQKGNLCTYLHEVLAHIMHLSIERRYIFMCEMVKLQSEERYYERKGPLAPVVAQKSYLCTREILRAGSMEENRSILEKIIERVDDKSLPVVCEIIVRIEESYGRIGGTINSTGQFITEEALENLEILLFSNIKKLSEEFCILDSRDIEDIYRFWTYMDEHSWNEYIADKLKITANIPKYLDLYVHTWYGAGRVGWTFDKKTLEENLDIEDVYERILGMKNTDEFSSLQHRFKQIAIAFYIWHDQDIKNTHDISEEIVNKTIREWEK